MKNINRILPVSTLAFALLGSSSCFADPQSFYLGIDKIAPRLKMQPGEGGNIFARGKSSEMLYAGCRFNEHFFAELGFNNGKTVGNDATIKPDDPLPGTGISLREYDADLDYRKYRTEFSTKNSYFGLGLYVEPIQKLKTSLALGIWGTRFRGELYVYQESDTGAVDNTKRDLSYLYKFVAAPMLKLGISYEISHGFNVNLNGYWSRLNNMKAMVMNSNNAIAYRVQFKNYTAIGAGVSYSY